MKKKLKILILSDVYYPTPGGVSEHIFNFVMNMRDRGHIVNIIAPRGSKKSTKPEHDEGVIRIGKAIPITANKSVARVSLGFKLYWEVKDVIRNGGWDIIHSHGPFAPVMPYLAHKFASNKYNPNTNITANIATFHASFRKVLFYDITKKFLRKRFKNIDGLIAVSEEAKFSVKQYFDGDFTVIPNGVDSVKFNPDLPRIDKFKKENFNIFFAGRFDTRKGINYLVLAFYFILKKIPNAFLWIGGGDKYRRFGLDLLRKRISAKDERFSKRVEYLRFIPHKELPRYFASADLFCSPAIGGESFGIVLIESMSCGTPVVASNIPGYRDVITNSSDGYLAEPKNVHDIAKKIILLAKNEKLRKAMSFNGRKKVLEKFSWDIVTTEIEDYYYYILKKKMNEAKK